MKCSRSLHQQKTRLAAQFRQEVSSFRYMTYAILWVKSDCDSCSGLYPFEQEAICNALVQHLIELMDEGGECLKNSHPGGAIGAKFAN